MKKRLAQNKMASQRNRLKATKKKMGTFSYYTLVVSLGCLLFLLTGILQLVKKESKPPCANSISCINDLTGRITDQKQGIYEGKIVQAPQATYFAQAEQELGYKVVLGDMVPSAQKHIYVDLSQQRLYAFQGSTLVFNDQVATGKWHLTPTGTFAIWIKLQATLMAGGEGDTGYYLPNVPWTMYFYNAKVDKSQGYSLHGEYWYNPDTGLGKPQSHGCINMRISDAKALFDWVSPPTQGYTSYATDQNPGTLVTIYGTTPNDGLVGSAFYNNNVSFNAGSQI